MTNKSVLVFGDYSGYGKSLVKGFRMIGYHSDVLSFGGDGFKKIEGDLNFFSNNRLYKLINFIKLIPKILSYKNILIMNPVFLDFRFLGPLIIFLAKIKKTRLILLACGDDVEFIKQGIKGNLVNWPYCDCELPSKKHFQSNRQLIIHKMIAKYCDFIIPAMYDYRQAWALSQYKSKVTETIPLACDGKLCDINEIENKKLTIMHGINREDFKGTKVIKEALNRIEKEYKSSVVIVYPEKLSLKDYLKLLGKVDISIDQTKSNSYGMNAIYCMLNGHVVLAPASNLFINDLSLSFCPIISIDNDAEDIYFKLKLLIENKNELIELKRKTQKYAVDIHSPEVIAKKISKYLKF